MRMPESTTCSIGLVTPRTNVWPNISNSECGPIAGRTKSAGPGGSKPSERVTSYPVKLPASPVPALLRLRTFGCMPHEAVPRHEEPQTSTHEDPDGHQERGSQPPIRAPAECSVHQDA